MPGQEAGNAIADVLFGLKSPRGRLPLTFPAFENQIGFTDEQWPGVDLVSNYTEKLLVGYRWYDEHGAEPAFPFGHGLAYTRFGYGNLAIDEDALTVSLDVTNEGDSQGDEVVQLYLAFPSHAGEPPQQLKAYTRVSLDAGETQTVTLSLAESDFAVWDDRKAHAWVAVNGTFGVHVGASSRDVRAVGEIKR